MKKFLILGLIPLLLIVPGTAFGDTSISPEKFILSLNELESLTPRTSDWTKDYEKYEPTSISKNKIVQKFSGVGDFMDRKASLTINYYEFDSDKPNGLSDAMSRYKIVSAPTETTGGSTYDWGLTNCKIYDYSIDNLKGIKGFCLFDNYVFDFTYMFEGDPSVKFELYDIIKHLLITRSNSNYVETNYVETNFVDPTYEIVNDTYIIFYNVYVENPPSNLPFEIEDTLDNAFLFWESEELETNNQKAKIKFVETSLKENLSLWIKWESSGSYDTQILEEQLLKIPLGFYDDSGKYHHYDSESMERILKHNLGHVIGLKHVSSEESVMHPLSSYFSSSVETTLSSESEDQNQITASEDQNTSINISTLFPSPDEIDTSKSGISPDWKAQPINDLKKDFEYFDGILQMKGRVYTNNESWIVNEIVVGIGEFSSRQKTQTFYETIKNNVYEGYQNDSGVENLTAESFIISEEECTKINFWKRYDWHNEIYCIRDNYSILIMAHENMSSDADELLTKILSKFPPSQKLLEKQKLEQEKFLEQRKQLGDGEILVVESKDKTELTSIVLLEKNNMNLLKINFVKEFNEQNSPNDYPFGSLSANDEFTNEYEQWINYHFLSTEDVTVFGSTIKGSDDWDTDCPSYVGRGFNPNIPYEFIACFEIPKNVNYFKFEGLVFTKASISSGDKSIFQNTSDPDSSSNGGGCLIATATFDSELAPQVQKLREIRDSKLLQTESGTQFMESFNSFYYSFSPGIADYERENPVFKEMVKIGVTPLLTTLSLMDYAESESEVLTVGISLIILNGMMYVGIPVIGIIVIRRF